MRLTEILSKPIVQRELFYKVSEERMYPLEDDNEMWDAFCKNIYVKDSKESKIAKALEQRETWMEALTVIWHKNKPKEEDFNRICQNARMLLTPDEKDKRLIILLNHKRFKGVTVHIM